MEKKVAVIQNLSINLDLPQCDLPDNILTRAINFVCTNNKIVATKESVPAPKLSKKGPWPLLPGTRLIAPSFNLPTELAHTFSHNSPMQTLLIADVAYLITNNTIGGIQRYNNITYAGVGALFGGIDNSTSLSVASDGNIWMCAQAYTSGGQGIGLYRYTPAGIQMPNPSSPSNGQYSAGGNRTLWHCSSSDGLYLFVIKDIAELSKMAATAIGTGVGATTSIILPAPASYIVSLNGNVAVLINSTALVYSEAMVLLLTLNATTATIGAAFDGASYWIQTSSVLYKYSTSGALIKSVAVASTGPIRYYSAINTLVVPTGTGVSFINTNGRLVKSINVGHTITDTAMSHDGKLYCSSYADNVVIVLYPGTTVAPPGKLLSPFINIVSGSISQQHYFLVSGLSSDFLFNGSSWLDITSIDKVANKLNNDRRNLWTTCKLGFNTIVNNSEVFPEFWSGQFGELLKPLAFSPTTTFKSKNIKCKAMRSHKNFLFALNLTEQGVEYPYSYRWSHPADENGLPFSWDELDLSTLASKESIGGDYGFIVDGLSLRDSFCIYTERAIHVLDYTGDEFVFRRRLLTSSYGAISQNCIVEAENIHYVITTSDIIANDGTSVQSLLTGRIKTIFSTISQQNYRNSFAVINVVKTEIWFCIPEGEYLWPSLAIVYNYITKQFGLVRLSSSDNGLGVMSSICFGIMLPNAYPWDELNTYFSTWDTWSLPVDSYQNFQGIGYDGELPMPSSTTYTSVWDNSVTPLQTTLFCVGPDLSYIEQLDGSRVYNGGIVSSLATILEKTNWAIDGQLSVKTLTRVYPNFEVVETSPAVGQALLYVGAHDYNNSAIRWDSPIAFNPLTDRKIDVRTTGELLAIRFEFKGYEEIIMYGYTIEYTLNGVR